MTRNTPDYDVAAFGLAFRIAMHECPGHYLDFEKLSKRLGVPLWALIGAGMDRPISLADREKISAWVNACPYARGYVMAGGKIGDVTPNHGGRAGDA